MCTFIWRRGRLGSQPNGLDLDPTRPNAKHLDLGCGFKILTCVCVYKVNGEKVNHLIPSILLRMKSYRGNVY